jgi:hypothetical protein
MIAHRQARVSAADNSNICFLGAFETGIGRYGVGQGFQPPAFGSVVIHFLSPFKKADTRRTSFAMFAFLEGMALFSIILDSPLHVFIGQGFLKKTF